jgi:tryptophan-rich sensory protein
MTTRRTATAVWFAFVVVSFLAAVPGAFFAPGEWYAGLERPFFAPPSWVFGPVWTLLYLVIGTSGWLVWHRRGWRTPALAWWAAQWLLNAAWTPLFFGAQLLGPALLEMTALWVAIAGTISASRRDSPTAAALLVPYLVWVSFAWVLNFGFWWLNR